MPPKFKINHKNAVAFVRKVLADDRDDVNLVTGEEMKDIAEKDKETDLWYKESDLIYTKVKVHEKFQFDPKTGLLTDASRDKILGVYTKFVSEDKLPFKSPKGKVDVKKILVFTNWQVKQQFEDLLSHRRKSIINTTDVDLLLIQYPIFKNDDSGMFGNFVKNCSNKTLTVPELIGALKFGIVKLNDLPEDLRDAMWIMLTKHGYPSYNVVKQKRK